MKLSRKLFIEIFVIFIVIIIAFAWIMSVYRVPSIMVGTIAAMSVFGVSLYLIIARFLNALQRISDGAAAMAGGEPDHRISIDSDDELSELGDSCNRMARALQKTRSEKAEVEGIIGNISEALIVTDRDGNILRVNIPACKSSGREGEELVGKSIGTILITTEEIPFNTLNLRKFFERNGELKNYEATIRTRAGKHIPVLVSSSVMRDGKGAIIRILYTAREITERKKAEGEIRRTYEMQSVFKTLLQVSLENISLEEMLEFFIDLITPIPWLSLESKGSVFLVEDDPEILTLKAQRGFSSAQQQACGRVPVGGCLCGKAAATGEIIFSEDVDERHERRCDGAPPHRHYCIPLISSRKNLLGVINLYLREGCRRDRREEEFLRAVSSALVGIIERKLAEDALVKSKEALERMNRELREKQAQLIQSEKMASIGQLAAGVAHEINNPVGFVMSNLGTLSDYVTTLKNILSEYDKFVTLVRSEGVAAGKDAADILERIDEISREDDLPYILEDVESLITESDEGTHRIKEIVQSLKSFARVDEAKVKEVDINELIETTLKVVWNELKYKCDVHKDFGELPPLRCFPGQLNQVFMNLLVNAAQAIPEHGDINIRTGEQNSEIIIRVSDTGKGIPQKALGKLFTPFYTTKPVGKGTGLGLYISHGIVLKHSGRIEVESEVGKGTVFTIHLPLEGVKNEPQSSPLRG